jgi:DNA-directed RNA polymerase specialized sigma24 family protein
MTSEGSITHWLRLAQHGEERAVRPLWERYFHLLVARARAALRRLSRSTADDEDVALGAFESFCRGAKEGRFPNINDRNDLWRVLVVLTAWKAARLVRGELRHKRGGGRVETEADLPQTGTAEGQAVLERIVGMEPTPAFAAQVAEESERLLDKLGSDELRSIAVSHMEGYTVGEVAGKFGRSPRTIARKLQLIRGIWHEEGALWAASKPREARNRR